MTKNDSAAPKRAVSIVLAGGGTAGHISPMLAIAEALVSQSPHARVCAVGTASGMETRLVPAANVPLELIERVPFPRKPSSGLVAFPHRFGRAVQQSGRILEAREADVVVGVGGYVCTPVYLAAARRRVPLVIHEANAKPGLANRVGARCASVVATAFDDTPLKGAVTVGMPMREEIAALDRGAMRTQALRHFGLDATQPTVAIIGGSSGALSINRTVAEVAHEVAARGHQILHVTGRGKEIHAEGGQLLHAPGYVQVDFVDRMELVYAAADLLVARSGAATVSEAAVVGLPAIFVPLPIGNGEQALNARSLVAAGGAQLVKDTDFTPQYYRETVAPLVTDPSRLADMAQASLAHGNPNAAETMARLILNQVRHQ